MPTYDYRCNACAHEFELFQSMSDKVKKKCPACGKLALERLIGTGAAVIFKGDGFYQTDYRSESYKKAAEADKKAASPASESTDSSSKSATTKDAPAKNDAGKSDGGKSGDKSGGKTKAAKPAKKDASPTRATK